MQQSSINTLQKYIQQNCENIRLDDESVRAFFEEKTLPKKSNILTENEVCKYEGFIINGCTKSFLTDKNGDEIVLSLSTENWWISDIVSFREQIPAKLNITTLEKTTLLLISFENKELLLQKHSELERMFRILIQNHLVSLQKRVFNSFALTTEERYNLLLQKRPQLFQRVPQYLIASYLGVTPEFLSRMRAKRVKK